MDLYEVVTKEDKMLRKRSQEVPFYLKKIEKKKIIKKLNLKI